MSGEGVTPVRGPESKELLQYGGQAVIEGVMMRSPHYFAVACRKPDGTIVVQREPVANTILGKLAKLKFLKWPFVRGTFALIDAMALGTRALAYASNVQMQTVQTELTTGDTGGNSKGQRQPEITSHQPPATSQPNSKINDIAIGGTIIFSLCFAVVLFKLMPTLITPGLQRIGWVSKAASGRQLNLLDGVIRMTIFFGYIGLISQMAQIKRVFQYHGAEHKAINTLEAGLPLTKENALQASRIHPRCGTSFIFIVLLIDLIVVAFLPRFPFFLARFALQVAVVPFVAGASYEIIKFAGKFRRNPLVMAAFAPGMATQYLTTREPDGLQTEVALAALYSVLQAEGHAVPQNDILTTPHESNEDEPAVAIA